MAKRPPADMCPRPGAVRFFEQNAGSSYRPGVESRRMGTRRSARALAVAECVADREGAVVEWEIDQDADRSYGDNETFEGDVFCARVVTDDDRQVSLCGIFDPDRNYKRVVEAELAAEAFADEIEPIERRLETRRGRPLRLGRR